MSLNLQEPQEGETKTSEAMTVLDEREQRLVPASVYVTADGNLVLRSSGIVAPLGSPVEADRA